MSWDNSTAFLSLNNKLTLTVTQKAKPDANLYKKIPDDRRCVEKRIQI